MKQITINGDKYQLPSRWNELTASQLLIIAELSLQEDSPAAIRTKAFFGLMGFTVNQAQERIIDGELCYYVSNSKKTYLLRLTDILYMCEPLSFMFEKTTSESGEEKYQYRSRLFKQLISKIKVAGKIWHGTADGLTNILFSEYIRCETYFAKFLETENLFFADCLIATMYRPIHPEYKADDIRFSADCREPLNDFNIENRAKQLNISHELRQAILFFYEGCKYFLTQKYPLVFESVSKKTEKKLDTFENYIRLATSLAKNDATQVDAWLSANLHAVMLAMDNARAEQKELEKLYKKNK